ncbi:MAG: radical SAM protein [Oscillospiraceae bacterium]|nr:radical SAM protein [Oscillospiraceae bacterium]
MQIYTFQQGFNYSQDGPGNRLVLHLQGCNMRCPWCSNPEGISVGADAKSARETRELTEHALRCKPMFFDGGGVTLTGGEPTVQFDAVAHLLRELQAAGIHTCIETNGTHPKLPELYPHVDHLIIDFKHPHDDAHKRLTGQSNAQVKANIEAAQGRQLHVRFILLHGHNTHLLDDYIGYFTQLDTSQMTFELLPYHELGRGKWDKYAFEPAFVPDDTLQAFKQALKHANLKEITT